MNFDMNSVFNLLTFIKLYSQKINLIYTNLEILNHKVSLCIKPTGDDVFDEVHKLLPFD